MITILRKELADYFTSVRFIVFFGLILGASAVGLYAAYEGLRGVELRQGFVFVSLYTTAGTTVPFSLLSLITMLIPIIGIAFGFDAVNSERSGGTLSRIMAQPIYRDNVINAKFLAGLITLAIMVGATILIVGGYGLRMIGVLPTSEELFRLLVFYIYTIIFGAFWMALAVLFSIAFRRIATSLLSSIGVWIFLFIIIGLVAQAIANGVAPVSQTSSAEQLVQNYEVQRTIMRISPITLYGEATSALLSPTYGESILMILASPAASFYLDKPLALGQALLLIWPQLTTLLSLTTVVFAISYILFMRQEIRST